MTVPPPPKKGPGAYGDAFSIRRIEGGYLLTIEHTEVRESVAGEDSPLRAVPAHLIEHLNRQQHTRQVVAKTVGEIVGHLNAWTDGSTS